MLNDRLVKWLSREQPARSGGGAARRAISLSTDIGLVRDQNQDRVACMRLHGHSGSNQSFIAIAVSDGMGGMKNGAECAIRTIAGFFDSLARNRHLDLEARAQLAAKDANANVYKHAEGYGGATLSAIVVSETNAVIVNVGDSRVYAEDEKDYGRLARLTIDDSMAEVVGGKGRELLQFIGMGESLRVKSSLADKQYDRILLTTDGVHFLPKDTLDMIVAHASDLSLVVSRISNLVRWSGAPDNATLAAISLSAIREELSVGGDSGMEFWDPFGDFYFGWVAAEEHKSNIGIEHAGASNTKARVEGGETVGSRSSYPQLEKYRRDIVSKSVEEKYFRTSNPRLQEIKNRILQIQDEAKEAVGLVEHSIEDREALLNIGRQKKKNASGSKRSAKPRKKTAPKTPKDSENLQIVIEMDSDHREDSDESSGKI